MVHFQLPTHVTVWDNYKIQNKYIQLLPHRYIVNQQNITFFVH